MYDSCRGVRLVSITLELGDDPMSNMIRQTAIGQNQDKQDASRILRN